MTNFTTINHHARMELGLSMNEYAVADLIYHLSNNPKGEIQGWCYAGKKKIGEMIGLSEQSIHTILNMLLKKQLIEKHPETRHLRTTSNWYDKAVINKDTKESLPILKKVEPLAKDSLAQDTKESLVDNYIYNKDINKDTLSPNGDKGESPPKRYGNEEINEVIELFEKSLGSLPRQQLNRYAAKRLIRDRGKDRILKAITFSLANRDDRYCPTISNLLDLEQKWIDLETYARRMIKGGGNNGKHFDAEAELQKRRLDRASGQKGLSLNARPV